MLRLRRFWLRLSCAISRSRWLLETPYLSSRQRSGRTLLIGWKIMAPTTYRHEMEPLEPADIDEDGSLAIKLTGETGFLLPT